MTKQTTQKTEAGLCPITIQCLTDEWRPQLFRLENSYLAEIGEDPLTSERQMRLAEAVSAQSITFLLALQGARAVGMCSIVTAFSTFACGPVGTFEDFYVEPDFRGKGIARLLVEAAQGWCRDHSVASLSVTCAPCDEGLYQALGFTLPLGRTFACLIG